MLTCVAERRSGSGGVEQGLGGGFVGVARTCYGTAEGGVRLHLAQHGKA